MATRIAIPDDGIAIEERRRYIEGWNKTMLDIWMERIYDLGIMDTKALYRSPDSLAIKTDPEGRFYDITLSHTFLEYGLWQDLGVGRNVAHGNTHARDQDGWTNKRERRRWFSTKYYSSVMKLRDFYAHSLGKEFIGLFASLDADNQRRNTAYYKNRGWS